MQYRSCFLLSNSAFSSKSGIRYRQYSNLINLAKGVIPSSIDSISITEMKKFKMNIEPDSNYVSNIHDFDFYFDNKDPTIVYVLDANTRQFLGKLMINYNVDDLEDCGIFELKADLTDIDISDNISHDNDNFYQDSIDIEPVYN
uniref:Uncharacterized protein n=1 Tax=Chrysodeixis includens nucleopolyhedrovirus TaxID=1207438 RepID=A0A6B9CIP9_9ABAC|nr:hypothetical protein [Chrysodeixis includens nucleopolyhedrovirus]QGW49296.1 hypothetical protein [Chrysodeixis includens nucleopolyhedrovirus]QGW49436.1 hypothetical protein [Chrysodeixis includens nucleopolyhedrovirus]QGW49576.1 hypothetical protein [Chrysodeixis includens nucleopolyhedrovirus]QGW49716.1 hypothetical protein [Chrysodeixis includens nucleopolyhedrovirus]